MVRKHKTEFQKSVSGCSKELSGAEKRKRRKLQDEKILNLQKSAERYFRRPSDQKSSPEPNMSDGVDLSEEPHEQPTTCTPPFSNAVDSQMCLEPDNTKEFENSPMDNMEPEDIIHEPTEDAEMDHEADAKLHNDDSSFASSSCDNRSAGMEPDVCDIQDPSTWPVNMTTTMRHAIMISTSSYVFSFSESKSDLCLFWKRHSTGIKANKEQYFRTWLRVSKSTKSAFCLPCIFYAVGTENKSCWSNSGNVGFQDFHHGLRGVTRHEESASHLESVTKLQSYLTSARNLSSTLSMMTRKSNENAEEWRLILRGIVDALLFLVQNNLALQGHSHCIQDDNCGNFLNLIKLLAKYYAPLAKHVERLKKKSPSYLSPRIQNEFISICGDKVKQKIIENIKKRKYYSIMFDSTPDTSHQEQVSQIIRSVECTGQGCTIHENFLDFISTTAKTGAALSEVIVEKLTNDGLELSDCKGQGYDNGANMSGCYSGVQARIREKNPEARFLPCAAHSLNLVGVNAAEKVLPAKLLLGIIQNLYTFFSASPARWEVLTGKVKLTLKGQSSTRWSSKATAVSALQNNFGQVVEALTEISISDSFAGDVNAAAESRLADILNFKFLLGLTIWSQILYQINTCNISLQAKNIDVSMAEKMLSVLIKWLEEFSTSGYENCNKIATELAEAFDISRESGFSNVRRGRGVNAKYDNAEQVATVKSMSNIQRFKKEFFDKILEKMIQEMTNRFCQIRQCVEDFSFLWGKGLSKEYESVLKWVKDLCLKYPNDFKVLAFSNEMQIFRLAVQEFLDKGNSIDEQGPMDVLNILYKNGLATSFPNCETALRIFLTLPVSVASNERAFSKLKLIKNYLRSSMGQDRLCGLAIISTEKEIVKAIDFDDIINDFVTKKCRRVHQL